VARYPKTQADLSKELDEQLNALRTSCVNYDQGQLWEAKRLATIAYILLHDSVKGKSRSLLTQLNIRSGLKIPTSIRESIPDRTRLSWNSRAGLITVHVSGEGAAFSPKLGRDGPYKEPSVHAWYDEVVSRALDNASVTRKNLIHYLRSQDGGAHVDPHLNDPSYYEWKTSGDPALRFEGGTLYGPLVDLRTGKTVAPPYPNSGQPVPNAVPAAMRQIAWEIDQALGKKTPKK
jgi:hypothetical protein